MEKYVINGGISISGSVKLESAKNAVLPMIAGAILTEEEVIIKNCPKLGDVLSMVKILNHLGVGAEFVDNNLVINSKNINGYKIPYELSGKLRSSVYFLGALISRLKKVELGSSGGCNIGKRPIDLHILALEDLGVYFASKEDGIVAEVDRIKGKKIRLEFASVGATENIMLASCLAEGETEIINPAKEPEVVDLMNFLNSMGAKISGAGTNKIVIEGVKSLHKTTYEPIKDRIEAGTYLIAGVITRGEVEIIGCRGENILPLLDKFLNNTCKIYMNNDIIYIKSRGRLKSFSFSTGPYPLFPTDMQAQTMSLLAVSNGNSIVRERVFENRFNHVPELIKMGAKIKVHERSAIINGVPRLHGAMLDARDLRGGASLVLSALAAEGKSVINGAYHVERGYKDFEYKLKSLGADIKKI